MGDRQVFRLLVTGAFVSFLAAAAGAAVVGPVVRQIFGAPHDYASDYTSPQALMQALLVQTATLVAAFLLSGWVLSKWLHESSWTTALWAANPVTVGSAFLLLMWWLDGAVVLGGQITWEYVGTSMWAIQVCLAVPLYASALALGVRMGRGSTDAT